MPTVAFVVTGRVQGVGFRAFVCRIAHELDLTGEVWNSRGGTVEVIARHEDGQILDKFRDKLAFGPGRIDGIHGGFVDVATAYDAFSVSYRS